MDMQKLMQQAQQMQQQMEAAQAKLATEKVEASAGGGMVTVVATGAGEITSIEIDPEAVDPEDVELLQDMVLAAVNEAHRMAGDLANQRMGGIMPGGMGGMGLPGF
jgi:DNA-binding YbaB/EbfC family protein